MTRNESLADTGERRNAWQMLAGLFAVPLLRYAAFAAALLIVAGVAFIALRPRPERSALVAGSQSEQQQPVKALKPTQTNSSPGQAATPTRAASPLQSADSSGQNPKRDESRVAENTTPPSSPMKEIDGFAKAPEKKAEEPAVAQSQPYAPAPPGDTQTAARAQPGAGVVTMSDSRKAADKLASGERERDMKDSGRADDGTRTSGRPATAMRRGPDEKSKGPSRNMNVMTNNQNANEAPTDSPKTWRGVASTEASSQTRSVGGRKFRRQGNAWIDQKFKSSMPLKKISRGSEEFAALDSSVRSIAQQLGGEIIVVSKGKAFLIN
ncbi:MAG: hypothetical protein ABR607_12570 [Pyrinomonadaceae bacterium]